jgi:hypothetical protein
MLPGVEEGAQEHYANIIAGPGYSCASTCSRIATARSVASAPMAKISFGPLALLMNDLQAQGGTKPSSCGGS